jgi:hypothetical protein
VGSILVTGSDYPKDIRILGAVALFASMTNIVSGFLITNRMLKLFKQEPKRRSPNDGDPRSARVPGRHHSLRFALYFMNHPRTARRGVVAGTLGMALAVLATWAQPQIIHHGGSCSPSGRLRGRCPALARSTHRGAAADGDSRHAFGGLAAGLVGTAKFYLWLRSEPEMLTHFRMIAIIARSSSAPHADGSLMAAGKLQRSSGSRSVP